MNALRNIFRIIMNFFFPPQCVFCDRILEINVKNCLCENCRSDVSRCREKLCCQKCGKPVVSYGRRALCYFCAETSTKYFDRIVSVFEYEGAVRDSVLRYKNAGIQSYAETYAELLAERIGEEYQGLDFDFICAAPSHENKDRKMGFDPVELICHKLSRRINIPHKRKVLKKTRETERQAGLSMQSRMRNLKNSMAVGDPKRVEGKRILLVDDICTTCATMIECSRALKKAGAKSVHAITFATTVK